EYIVYHGAETSYDLWEETHGHHFYTRMAQRRALVLGAADARRRGDLRAARRYRKHARALERALHRHWNPARGIIEETLDWDGGCDYKATNLDAGVVLATLHADGADRVFAPGDDRVLATAARLKKVFGALYPINLDDVGADGEALNTAIGRYPE